MVLLELMVLAMRPPAQMQISPLIGNLQDFVSLILSASLVLNAQCCGVSIMHLSDEQCVQHCNALLLGFSADEYL